VVSLWLWFASRPIVFWLTFTPVNIAVAELAASGTCLLTEYVCRN
jgi:hypothetical protein